MEKKSSLPTRKRPFPWRTDYFFTPYPYVIARVVSDGKHQPKHTIANGCEGFINGERPKGHHLPHKSTYWRVIKIHRRLFRRRTTQTCQICKGGLPGLRRIFLAVGSASLPKRCAPLGFFLTHTSNPSETKQTTAHNTFHRMRTDPLMTRNKTFGLGLLLAAAALAAVLLLLTGAPAPADAADSKHNALPYKAAMTW